MNEWQKMKTSLWLVIAVAFLVLFAVALPACDKSDDGDDDDDDTDYDGLPDAMEQCWEPYREYEPWFEWSGFFSHYYDYFGDWDGDESIFVPATATIDGGEIHVGNEDWSFSITWLTDAVTPPFVDGQAVQVSIRHDLGGEDGVSMTTLWVLDENDETLLFYYPYVRSTLVAVGDQLFMFDVFLGCQVAEGSEPERDTHDWIFVFQRGLNAVIGDVGVVMTTLNTGLDYSLDGGYAFTVTRNFIGKYKDPEAGSGENLTSDGTFQMVRLTP